VTKRSHRRLPRRGTPGDPWTSRTVLGVLSRFGGADDNYGAMGMNGTLLTNRPEEKAAEATESAGTYHQEVGSLARVYEVLSGRSLVGDPFESDPGAISATWAAALSRAFCKDISTSSRETKTYPGS